ncbi:large ribosomal subunit protein uL13m-like [Oscarella lobularis]|uniref:large ribosomal subunit protein uL13m-like n=1 Tax=Oscarella lobularis TaxID=121494 RepID=UPI003313DAC6
MASKLSQNFQTFTRMWYLIDGRGQVVGRLASMLSGVLQGKIKPIYHPATDIGDHVVVINTGDVVFTGRKWEKKLYRHHTGYPGGLKEIVAEKLHNKDETMVLRKAVYGMLPKNNLRKKRMRRLHLFPTDIHPYQLNITATLEGPCLSLKRLEDYTKEEIENYPKLFDTSHLLKLDLEMDSYT